MYTATCMDSGTYSVKMSATSHKIQSRLFPGNQPDRTVQQCRESIHQQPHAFSKHNHNNELPNAGKLQLSAMEVYSTI